MTPEQEEAIKQDLASKFKREDFYKKVQILLLSALITFTGYLGVQVKNVYDQVSKVVILKESDHADWLAMKSDLTENTAKDNREHEELYKRVQNIDAKHSDLLIMVEGIEDEIKHLKND